MITKLSHGLDHIARPYSPSESIYTIDMLTLWTIQNGSVTWYVSMQAMSHVLRMPTLQCSNGRIIGLRERPLIILLNFGCSNTTVDRNASKPHFPRFSLRCGKM
jgi:hypothetical protein